MKKKNIYRQKLHYLVDTDDAGQISTENYKLGNSESIYQWGTYGQIKIFLIALQISFSIAPIIGKVRWLNTL